MTFVSSNFHSAPKTAALFGGSNSFFSINEIRPLNKFSFIAPNVKSSQCINPQFECLSVLGASK